MSIIADLKRRFFYRRLKKELAARRVDPIVRPLHPNSAKVLAILFPADDADDRKLIERLREKRRKEGLQTKLLGYFSTAIDKNGSYNFPFFTIKDLNWAGVPQGKEVEQFLQEPCDLLYVLGQAEDPRMDYLTRLKPAALRVGPFTREDDPDTPYNVRFIMDNPDGRKGLKAQLEQIDRIFKILNAKKVAAV